MNLGVKNKRCQCSMQSQPVSAYDQASVDRLTSLIPLFRKLKQEDPSQYQVLLQSSWLVSFEPGEVILKQGDMERCLYFMLKGKAAVLSGDSDQPINYITPGEVFGDLSMLLKQPRSATIEADYGCKETMAFATDFAVFGGLLDFSRISLSTKLAYFRNLAHSLRWKLEVYRNQHPQHELANQHRSIKPYVGPKDGVQELEVLDNHARLLAQLLVKWNARFGHISLLEGDEPNEELLAPLAC